MTSLHLVLKNHTECSQEGPSSDSPSDLTMQILGYTKKVSTREGATLKLALLSNLELLYCNEACYKGAVSSFYVKCIEAQIIITCTCKSIIILIAVAMQWIFHYNHSVQRLSVESGNSVNSVIFQFPKIISYLLRT